MNNVSPQCEQDVPVEVSFGRKITIVAAISVCWVLTAMGQIKKNMGEHATVAGAAMILVVALLLVLIPWLQKRFGRASRYWIAATWVLIACAHLVLYPIAASKRLAGMGSDRENALVRADTELLHHHFPYYPKTFAHNPISPMPGSLMLSLPFFLLGRVGYECLLWTALLAFSAVRFYKGVASAVVLLVVMILSNPGVMDELIAGDDYTMNAIYLSVSVLFFLWSFAKNRWMHAVMAVFLGLSLSSRPIYVVFIPLLVAWLLKQGKPLARSATSVAIMLCVTGGITLPFYLYDPANFSPLHVWDKLHFLPPASQKLLGMILPAAAIAVACLGFLQRLTISRLFLMGGICSGIILFPVAVLFLISKHFSLAACYMAGAVSPCLVFFSLWGVKELDGDAMARAAVRLEGDGSTAARPVA